MLSKRTAHVISHTHWDREWYLPYEQHRLRLVRLIDSLLDILDSDDRFRCFHLDGQTIVIEDYLRIRPHQEQRLREHVKSGRILIGPWYVLADGFLVTGESHVRNMLIGMEMSHAYGSPMMIGYFPDTFGNFSQAPQLLQGFGIDVAVFGRGVGHMVAQGAPGEQDSGPVAAPSELIWQGPDGSRVLAFRLANWYNNADDLPSDLKDGTRRVHEIADRAAQFTDSHHLLFMNGCDHTPVQGNIGEVIEILNTALQDIELVHSSLPEYAAVIKAGDRSLPTLTGELRDWDSAGWNTLDATLSSRMYLKQWNHKCERLLLRGMESLGALAVLAGGSFDPDVWRHAWKLLMENHPHDSICGCSIDAVHREMVIRFERVAQVAEAEIDRRLAELARGIDCSGFGNDPVVLVANTNGVAVRQRVTAVVEFPADTEETEFRVTAADGTEVPSIVSVLGVNPRYRLPEDRFREVYESCLAEVEFIAEVPPLGWHAYRVSPAAGTIAEEATDGSDSVLENEHLRVEIDSAGTLRIEDKATGRTFEGMNAFEDVGDVGDEYRHIAPGQQTRVTTEGLAATIGPVERSVVRQTVTISHYWKIPAAATKEARGNETVTLTLRTRLTLDRGARALLVRVDIDNPALDHRLRALFPSNLDAKVVRSSAPFDVVTRPITPPPQWENPAYLQPNDGFITLVDGAHGLTIAARGLPEFEVYRDGRRTLALTLLRCTGKMGDWFPFPTPEAQCLGKNFAEYAIIPHAQERDPLPEVQAYLNPLWVAAAAGAKGSLPRKAAAIDVDAPGVIVSTCKPAQQGAAIILRMWNTLDKPACAAITTHFPITEALRLNLDETDRQEPLAVRGNTFKVQLLAKEILTIGINLYSK